jgi:hypothetical protein
VSQIIPVVAGIHYDDIAKLFRLKISLELMSPLGNKRVEEVFELGDLVSVVAKIAEIWALAAGHEPHATIPFTVGDFTTWATSIQDADLMTFAPATPPDPYEDSSEYDGAGWATVTHWGETAIS